MKEKTFTESEIREVLAMMTTPCEDEIATTRRVSQGVDNDVSRTLPVMLTEAGAQMLADVLLSGQRDAHELRWQLIQKSAAVSVAWGVLARHTPPNADL